MLTSNGRLITHHLIDICNPDEPYSAADFQQDAARLIAEIHQRGRLSLLVGGTGLYIQALCDGFQLNEAAPADEKLRQELRQAYQSLGAAEMHRQLAQVDAVAAAKIAPQDEKRLLRALEVWHLTGRPISAQGRAAKSPYELLLLGLTRERAELYQRIEQRVDVMLTAGLLQETARLLAAGLNPELKPLQGLGYRQAIWYLQGLLSRPEMVRLIKRDTRRFAKRQLTWWRREERIHWFNLSEQSPEKALEAMLRLAQERFALR